LTRLDADVDNSRRGDRAFVERCKCQWLIGRHGHSTPREVNDA
jgi:hypothetical protein